MRMRFKTREELENNPLFCIEGRHLKHIQVNDTILPSLYHSKYLGRWFDVFDKGDESIMLDGPFGIERCPIDYLSME